MRPSFGAKINLILGLGLLVLVGVGLLGQRSIGDLVQTGRDEANTLGDLAQLEALLGTVRNAVALQRSFLLTGSEADLAAYRDARGRVGREVDSLRARVSGSIQLRPVSELGEAIGARVQRLDAVLEAARLRGPAAAMGMVRSRESAALDERIDAIARDMRASELQALRSRRANTEFNAGISKFFLGWGAAFACALLLWAMVAIQRHHFARRTAERAVRASEAQLRLITDSVPALIGYAAANGQLLFRNRAFEDWFGPRQGAAAGGTLSDAFGDEAFAVLAPHIDAVLAGRPAEFNFSLQVRGEPRDVSAQLVPHRDDAGKISGYYLLVTDVTALTEVERLKNEFVTTVSHELRTPLTSIRGSLGLIAAGVTGPLPEKARDLVAIATQNCERLVRLVNDVLDSERMMSGKMHFSLELVDLAEVAASSIRETEGFAAEHGVAVRFASTAAAPVVRADRDRLVQVLTNLLSNACKFSPSGATVDVVLEILGETARVSVSDRGQGIAAGSEQVLFRPFVRLDSSDVRRVGGTGLGLSISKGIVERLGGSIGYAHRPGGGSTFFFDLPLHRTAEVTPP